MKLFLFEGLEQIKNFVHDPAPLANPAPVRYAAAMLSVVIETLDDEDALARTLASLVGAAVEGVVREVVVCDRGSSDRTGLVAEHAGCVWLERADMAEAVRRAKGDWLLIIEPGARLESGWTEAVLRHVAEAGGPARFSPSRIGRPGLLARLFAPRRPLAAGLLIQKRQAAALAGFARRLRTRRLPAEIIVAPGR